jgi:hypothetical protein
MFSLGAASSALKNAFFPFTPSPCGWLNAKSEFGIGFAKAFITYTSVGRFIARTRISVKKPGLHLSGAGQQNDPTFLKEDS